VRFVRQVAALLFIIALPLALLLTNVRVIANEPRVYEYAVDHYNTTETTGFPRSELLRASAELRSYFNSGDGPISIRVQQAGQSVPLFSAREVAHLEDVKDLFQLSFRVQEAAIMFIIAYVAMVFIWAREGSVRRLAQEVLASAILGAGVILAIGFFAVTGFDAAFERFHLIAFSNDLWQLDPSRDHLIQMFPEAFWQDVTLWVGAATLIELALFAVGAALYLAFTRESRMRTVEFRGAVATSIAPERVEA
jgi:integral membrane protein (TIGR01906 family)